jgi:YHS domain-containing protein
VGSEVLPTPPGEVEVPLPKATPGKEPGKEKGEILPEAVLPPQHGPTSPEPATPAPKTEPAPLPSKETEKPIPAMPPPSGKQPLTTGPALEGPAEKPSPEKPSAEKPSAEKPSAEKPSAEKPSAEKPSAEKPSAEKPSAEKPSAEKPSAEKPSAGKPSPVEEELIPAEPLKGPNAAPKSIYHGGLEAPKAAPGSAPATVGSRAAASGNLQVDWDAALYPESMSGGQLRLVGAPALPPARRDVQLATYSEETAGSSTPMLDGYCPVQWWDQGRWVRGDARYQVVYRGRTVWLSGAAQRQQFLASPQRYAPARDGNDPVLQVEEGRQVRGSLQYLAAYHQRLYLFAGPATLQRFLQTPERYALPGD